MNTNRPSFSKLNWPPYSNKRLLSHDDAKIVFRVFDAIDTFVLKESGIDQRVAAAKKPVDPDVLRGELRDYWYNNPAIVDQFIQSTEGANLTEEEKQLLLSWKNPLRGKFLCVKYYADYAVLIPMDNKEDGINYYAVLGLTEDFDVLIPYKLPSVISTALLPYKDVIIWDGLIGQYGLSFGRTMASTFINECSQFRKEGRIISRLV